jgi:Papain family cysteine protease
MNQNRPPFHPPKQEAAGYSLATTYRSSRRRLGHLTRSTLKTRDIANIAPTTPLDADFYHKRQLRFTSSFFFHDYHLVFRTTTSLTTRNSMSLVSTIFILLALLLLLLMSASPANAQQEEQGGDVNEQPSSSSSSSSECITQCLEQNRTCSSASDNHGVCGSCIEGFVEFGKLSMNIINPTCVPIDTLTWQNFVDEYQPSYRKGVNVTVAERLALLKRAATFIAQHNSANQSSSSYTLGLTPYSVDSDLEYVQRSGYFYVPPSDGNEIEPYVPPTIAAADLASRVDWVERGGVTSVKNQGRCGSCWAVSMCGAVEGAAFANSNNNNYLQSLSFQQFVSCNERNLGCDGGNLVIASLYASLTDFGGVARLNDYEYTDFYGDTTAECLLSRQSTPVAVEVSEPQLVAGMTSGLGYEERAEQFKQVLEQQPIAMVIKSACPVSSKRLYGIAFLLPNRVDPLTPAVVLSMVDTVQLPKGGIDGRR